MKKSMGLLVLTTVAMIACGKGTAAGKTLVTINGEKITEGDLNFLGEVNPRIRSQVANPAGRQRILENLVEQDLLYKEAERKGVSRDAQVKAKVDLYRRVIIAQSLVDAEVEKSAKEYYDKNQDEFRKLELAHIMISYGTSPTPIVSKKKVTQPKARTEEEALQLANQIKARLDKGEKFADVAKEVSDDAATKNNGGSLGKVAKKDARMESRGFTPLLDKAFDVKVGEVAGPVKTTKGYHLITVTGGAELEPFEVAKERLLFKIQGDTRTALLARLKKDAKIVYAENIKKPEEATEQHGAAPTTPPTAAPQAATPAPVPAEHDQQHEHQ